jgi:hypothetical protein
VRHQIYTDREAADILVNEGHTAGHVGEEMTLLIRTGLTLDQPIDESLLTDDELALLRLRLREHGI